LKGEEVSLTSSHSLSKSHKSFPRSLSSKVEGSTRSSYTAGGGEVQMQQVEQHNVGAEHMSRFVSLASDASDAVAQAEPKRGMILPFQPLAISFDNINYYVDMPVVCVFFFRY
jgi:hypothetical protein